MTNSMQKLNDIKTETELDYNKVKLERKSWILGMSGILSFLTALSSLIFIISGVFSPWFLFLAVILLISAVWFMLTSSMCDDEIKKFKHVYIEEMLAFADSLSNSNFTELTLLYAKYVSRGFITKGEMSEFRHALSKWDCGIRNEKTREEWKRKAQELIELAEAAQDASKSSSNTGVDSPIHNPAIPGRIFVKPRARSGSKPHNKTNDTGA